MFSPLFHRLGNWGRRKDDKKMGRKIKIKRKTDVKLKKKIVIFLVANEIKFNLSRILRYVSKMLKVKIC